MDEYGTLSEQRRREMLEMLKESDPPTAISKFGFQKHVIEWIADIEERLERLEGIVGKIEMIKRMSVEDMLKELERTEEEMQ